MVFRGLLLRLAGLFGLLPSPGTGESGARARLASRTAVRCDFLSQISPTDPGDPLSCCV